VVANGVVVEEIVIIHVQEEGLTKEIAMRAIKKTVVNVLKLQFIALLNGSVSMMEHTENLYVNAIIDAKQGVTTKVFSGEANGSPPCYNDEVAMSSL
jgi:hypothetical protein